MGTVQASPEPEEATKNAFENYLIVKKLVELVEPEERLKLRQISKLFDNVVTEFISSVGFPIVERFEENSDINSFVKRMKNKNRCQKAIPFTAFELDLTCLSVAVIKKLTTAVDKYTSLFLTQSPPRGSTVYTVHETGQFLEKVTTLLSKCSELKYLTVDIPNPVLSEENLAALPTTFPCLELITFPYWQVYKHFPRTLFAEIFKRSPNLYYLQLKCQPVPGELDNIRDPPSNIVDLPTILFDCCCKPPKMLFHADTVLSIKDVPALTKMVEHGYDKILNLEMSYATYINGAGAVFEHLPIPDLIAISSAFNRFIALQCDSLVELNLHIRSRGQWYDPMQLVLPTFTNLRKLKISCCNYLQREVQRHLRPLRPFRMGQFPRLELLTFFMQRYEMGLFVETPVYDSVKSLDFTVFNTPVEPIPLGIVFPNLKKLTFWVFPQIPMLKDILANLVHLEELNLGSHPAEFLVASQRDSIWYCYTGGAKQLNRKQVTEFFRHQKTLLEIERATGSTKHGAGEGDIQQKGLENLRNLKKLCIPMESTKEFLAILMLLAAGKLPSLQEFKHNLEHPEFVVRTKKHAMKWDGENLAFINSVQRVLAFA